MTVTHPAWMDRMHPRRALRRVLNAMTTGGAPVAWPADPVTMTTEQARLALGLGPDIDPSTASRLIGATLHHPMLRADLGEPLADGVEHAHAQAALLYATLADTRRQRDDAKAELEDTRRHLRGTEAMLRAAQVSLEQQTLNTARLTRDLALRTTQRDKARSDRDRLQVRLNEAGRC